MPPLEEGQYDGQGERYCDDLDHDSTLHKGEGPGLAPEARPQRQGGAPPLGGGRIICRRAAPRLDGQQDAPLVIV